MMMTTMIRGMLSGNENVEGPPADFEGPSKTSSCFVKTEGHPGSH